MVVRQDQPIAMPRPFGGEPPTITISPRDDGKPGSHITVQITGVIMSPYQYLEFIQILDMATENDLIDVVLDTPGGCVFTTQVLLERMNSSKATVTAVASGLVASAGTFLWFFSKHRKVDDWATFMFHSSSHGDYGKSLAIQETSTEMVKYMHKTVNAMIAAGILTAEEATRIFRQKKDLFLPGSIIRARMLGEIAATEGLRLRDINESGSDDIETDPEGNPDKDAGDNVDGDTTEVGGEGTPAEGEVIPLDPAAIFRAEGVEVEEAPGEGQPETQDGQTMGAKKKGKKAKRRARCEGDEGDGATDDNGDEIEEGQGTGGAETDPDMAAKKRKAKKAKKRARCEGDGAEAIPDGAEQADTSDDEAVQQAGDSAYLRW